MKVVRAKKRGGSGLPGAAQRARSRQIGATLLAELNRRIKEARREAHVAHGVNFVRHCLWMGESAGLTKLRKWVNAQRRRRPFGANEKLADPTKLNREVTKANHELSDLSQR